MHGIIFSEFRQYVESRLGLQAWTRLVEQSGLANRTFLVAQQFPDAEFRALASAAAKRLGMPVQAVIEDFGEFIAPHLMKMHAHSVKPEWRTLDLIEHTEEAIHQVLRAGDRVAFPPKIACTRISERRAVVDYASPRRLCAFAKGIIRGVAASYGENVAIVESTCMLHGDAACTLEIEVAP